LSVTNPAGILSAFAPFQLYDPNPYCFI